MSFFPFNLIITCDIKYMDKSPYFNIGYISSICFNSVNHIFIHIINLLSDIVI